ncbi:hypothetical protein CBS63078_10207 [Aspergillus niger]|nr:hypothetical protein CBS63078_10207 [Aspergillus niger]
MQQFLFTDEESRLAKERHLKYKGTAKVDINDISFHPTVSRQIDNGKLERLRRIFRTEGCRRLDINNQVTAVVSGEHLQSALERVGIAAEALMTNSPDQLPQLHFPAGQLECLHGLHRITAGKDFLPPADRWWPIDIYLEDLSDTLRKSLLDEYSNETPPSDGEVYRKIRQYSNEHNARFRKRWWSRLSPNKERRLKALWRHEEFRDAFDKLLVIPGIWGGMRIGSLSKLMALKCDEEILNYLEFIRDFWSSLLDDNPSALMRVDHRTVERLQLKAPGSSGEDRLEVEGLIQSGQIFSEFTSSERDAIWAKLQCFDRIVPSLYTFFEDLKYFSCCAQCIQWLLITDKYHPTFRITMLNMLDYPAGEAHAATDGSGTECLIQVSNTKFGMIQCDQIKRFDLSYRQLWLYAMRHYPQMAKDTGGDNLAKAPSEKADEAVVHEMAALALRLGFKSKKINELMALSPDRQIARAALLKARKPGRYWYNPEQLDHFIDRIVSYFSKAHPCEGETAEDHVADPWTGQDGRCGLPRLRVHRQDRPFLFLDHMHAESGWAGDQISTLFIRRCVYFAFFGPSSSTSSAQLGVYTPSDLAPAEPLPASPLFCPSDAPDGAMADKEAEIERLRSEAQAQALGQQRLVREVQEISSELATLKSLLSVSEEKLRREVEKATGQDHRYHEAEIKICEQHAEIDSLRHQLAEQANATARLEEAMKEKAAQQAQASELHGVQGTTQSTSDQECQRQDTQEPEDSSARPESDETTGMEQIHQDTQNNRKRPTTQFNFDELVRPVRPNLKASEAATGKQSKMITIKLIMYERGKWTRTDNIECNLFDPSSFETVLFKYKRKYQRPGEPKVLKFYDTKLRAILIKNCLQAACFDDKNAILMSAETFPNSKEFQESVQKMLNTIDDGGQPAATIRPNSQEFYQSVQQMRESYRNYRETPESSIPRDNEGSAEDPDEQLGKKLRRTLRG